MSKARGLTDAEVVGLRVLVDAGRANGVHRSDDVLARMFGVSAGTVRNARLGIGAYRHIRTTPSRRRPQKEIR